MALFILNQEVVMKTKLPSIVAAGFLLVVIVIGGCNINAEGFWNATAIQVLTLLTAVGIAFFATQMKVDQRERKKYAEILLEKIQGLVLEESFYNIPIITETETQKEYRAKIQMVNKKLSNCIECLIQYSKPLQFEKEASYIKAEFTKYRQLVDEYLTDFELLNKLHETLKKYAQNIDSKCDQINVRLYC